MQIALHLGAHCTDEDRLLKALIGNQAALASASIAVPGPGRYRPLLREALAKLRGAQANPEMADAIRKHIIGDATPGRVVLGSDGFICAPRFVLGQRRIYPMIGDRVRALQGLFPGMPMQFSMGLRNPATLIPALHRAMEVEIGFERLTAPIEMAALKWSETLRTMQTALPDAEIVVWANEDVPMIWPSILQAVSGHPASLELDGVEDVLDDVLRPGGLDRLKAYLAERPGLDRQARQKITAVFLDKFGDENALEEQFDLPGWTEAVVWELTRAYELDLEVISQMPGIRLIRP